MNRDLMPPRRQQSETRVVSTVDSGCHAEEQSEEMRYKMVLGVITYKISSKNQKTRGRKYFNERGEKEKHRRNFCHRH